MHELQATAEKLALAVYRLTNSFPQNEPLRERLRERALDVILAIKRELATTTPDLERRRAATEDSLRHSEELILLCTLASPQGFVKEEHLLLLARHYRELGQQLRRKEGEMDKRNEQSENGQRRYEAGDSVGGGSATSKGALLNARQKKVLQHFRYRQSFQLREARVLFEGYSQKTLRNDLRELCERGILNREGVGTVSFYRVVSVPDSFERT